MRLHLIEDRPNRSIASPAPQPLDVALTTLLVTRDSSGVVKLGPPESKNTAVESPKTSEREGAMEEMEKLNRENEELKKRLVTLARIAEDNRDLRA